MLSIRLREPKYTEFLAASSFAETLPCLSMAYLIGWTVQNIGTREADTLVEGLKKNEKVMVILVEEEEADGCSGT